MFRPEMLEPEKKGQHFIDVIFKCIFLNENLCMLIQNQLKFVSQGPINNKFVLIMAMAWHCEGSKPLPEPVMTQLTEA